MRSSTLCSCLDANYGAVRVDLESDAQDLEADSWSLEVDPQYLKMLSKEVVKRQDVIYGKWNFFHARDDPTRHT